MMLVSRDSCIMPRARAMSPTALANGAALSGASSMQA